jgi:3-deoxy-D-manno-octulosonic-acid transferase
VTGAHTHNFHAIVDLMSAAGAIVQLPVVEGAVAIEELTHVLSKLFANAAEREVLGQRAKQLVTDNRGAAARTLELITPLLSGEPHASSPTDTMLAANAHTS